MVAVGWAAAGMGAGGGGSLANRGTLAWRRLLILFGPTFLLATLQLGRRAIVPAAISLVALVTVLA
jgi:hypothetical protein